MKKFLLIIAFFAIWCGVSSQTYSAEDKLIMTQNELWQKAQEEILANKKADLEYAKSRREERPISVNYVGYPDSDKFYKLLPNSSPYKIVYIGYEMKKYQKRKLLKIIVYEKNERSALEIVTPLTILDEVEAAREGKKFNEVVVKYVLKGIEENNKKIATAEKNRLRIITEEEFQQKLRAEQQRVEAESREPKSNINYFVKYKNKSQEVEQYWTEQRFRILEVNSFAIVNPLSKKKEAWRIKIGDDPRYYLVDSPDSNFFITLYPDQDYKHDIIKTARESIQKYESQKNSANVDNPLLKKSAQNYWWRFWR